MEDDSTKTERRSLKETVQDGDGDDDRFWRSGLIEGFRSNDVLIWYIYQNSEMMCSLMNV